MAIYNLCPVFEPQFVPSGTPIALIFSQAGFGGVVLAGYNIQIATLRVSNVTNVPQTLEVWRVPSGGSAVDATLVVPSIQIPPASQTFPYFDVTTLWGTVLQPGDSIFMQAGAGSALVVHADGIIVTL